MKPNFQAFGLEDFDDAALLAWISNEKGQFLYANRKLETIFFAGASPRPEETWQSLISEEDQFDLNECGNTLSNAEKHLVCAFGSPKLALVCGICQAPHIGEMVRSALGCSSLPRCFDTILFRKTF